MKMMVAVHFQCIKLIGYLPDTQFCETEWYLISGKLFKNLPVVLEFKEYHSNIESCRWTIEPIFYITHTMHILTFKTSSNKCA